MSGVKDVKEFNPEVPLKESLKLLIKSAIDELVSISRDNRGISNADVIHDIRVSARRLQTLFESIGEILPAPLLNKGKSTVKYIIKSLGKARENDVSIELIEKFLKKNKKEPGQDPLLLLLARFKKHAEEHRQEAISNSKVFYEIEYFNSQYLNSINNLKINSFRGIKYLDINQSLKANGLLLLPRFYDRIARHSKAALEKPDEDNSEELHKMRIKAKPLRYIMEFFRFAYGPDFAKLVKEMKDFVEILGNIHDRDVIIDQLNDFRNEMQTFNKIAGKKKMSVDLLNKFIKKLKTERKSQFKKIKNILQNWIDENFREKMIMSLS